jgi:hypothetical protein
MTQPLAEYAACLSGLTRGYCVNKECTPPRTYRVEDTDLGRNDGQVEYQNGSWNMAGSVHYSNTAGAYFLAHFVGTNVVVYGGKNTDRGKTEYFICNASGTGCSSPDVRDNYAASLQIEQALWSSPTLKFGAYTVKGRASGQKATDSTDYIVDLDYVQVN